MNRLSSRDWARIIALAAAYAVTAAIGLRLGATLHDTPPLWPAAGVAVAALCIYGVRLWPGVAIGTFAVFALRANGAPLNAVIIASTTIEAVVAAFVLQRFAAFQPDLRRARDAVALVIVAGIVAPVIGATIGAGGFALARGTTNLPHEWLDWFLGDAMGAIVFAPVVLAWLLRHTSDGANVRRAETFAFVIGLAASSVMALGVPLGGQARPVIFISFPFIVWGALRLGMRITMTAVAAVAVAASVAASLHLGVFAGTETVGSLLQTYLATAAATALIVAASVAERRDATARLHESERRLSLVHEATTDRIALFALEPAGVARLTFANSAYVDAVRQREPDLTPDQIIGSTTTQLAERLHLPPIARAVYQQHFATVARTAAPVHLAEYVDIDGTPNDVTLSPVRAEDGTVSHVLWKSHEVADRVQAEADLRDSEARLSLVFNSSSDTLLLFAVEGKDAYRLVMANRSLREELRHHRPQHGTRDVAGLTMRQFITEVLGYPAERVDRNNELFRRVIHSKAPLTYENADWGRPDLVSEVTLVPVFDHTGRCTHVLRSSRDITARKVAQDSLRLHDFVVTHAPLGVLMFDASYRVTFANDAACELLAEPRERLLEGGIGEVFAGGASTQWSDLLANLRSRHTHAAEVEWAASDGTRHPIELSIAFLEYAGEEISCVFVRDIAERRRAELTRRTLEAELFHAQKMEAIGTLAGGIAHDFNNILAAIVGNAEVAQSELPLGHPARQDISEVLVASRRARDLVRQILTFSRKQESVRRSVMLAEVVEDVLRLLRATIPSTIELRKSIAAPDAHVFGDPTQLHQVLMNLCTNAAHAVGDHHGIIEVGQSIVDVDADSTRTDLLPGRYVCVWVADSGHGMDRATLERVFEPFFTTKAPGVGTGLGLAVVHGIVRNHEGVALVESTPGRGTTFQLYFPLFTPTELRGPAETLEIPRGAGERVLFVDDELALTRVARRALERLGYTVSAFMSATEALDAVRADPLAFDVVISDLTMPGLTGAQLAVELHRLRENLPMILSTGYLDRVDADAASSMHVRELLIKPYTTEALATAVHRALRGVAA